MYIAFGVVLEVIRFFYAFIYIELIYKVQVLYLVGI